MKNIAFVVALVLDVVVGDRDDLAADDDLAAGDDDLAADDDDIADPAEDIGETSGEKPKGLKIASFAGLL